jgi:HEXXH motif-containing protein
MTLHPSQLTLAEALIHECQHGKINALSFLDPVLENAFTEWSPSPVRPDLRPLWGVLLAVHAFAPVSVLHARLVEQAHPLSREPEFARRRADVLRGNLHAIEILKEKARPTPLGRRLLKELSTLLHDLCERHPDPLTEEKLLPPS